MVWGTQRIRQQKAFLYLGSAAAILVSSRANRAEKDLMQTLRLRPESKRKTVLLLPLGTEAFPIRKHDGSWFLNSDHNVFLLEKSDIKRVYFQKQQHAHWARKWLLIDVHFWEKIWEQFNAGNSCQKFTLQRIPRRFLKVTGCFLKSIALSSLKTNHHSLLHIFTFAYSYAITVANWIVIGNERGYVLPKK